jgi:hypothetical protein
MANGKIKPAESRQASWPEPSPLTVAEFQRASSIAVPLPAGRLTPDPASPVGAIFDVEGLDA